MLVKEMRENDRESFFYKYFRMTLEHVVQPPSFPREPVADGEFCPSPSVWGPNIWQSYHMTKS